MTTKTMTVRVCDRGEGREYVGVTVRAVTIPVVCPKCGGPRGVDTVRTQRFCEDGEWYSVDRWDNPCGHVDMYADVLCEARAFTTAQAAWEQVTDLQREILIRVALGDTDDDIGRELDFKLYRVKDELKDIRDTAGVQSRGGLTGWAYRCALMPRLYADREPVTVTDRRAQVLDLLAHGKRTDDIARELIVSANTVRTLIFLTARDLQARNRAQAVALAYELGLLQLPFRLTKE
jgi:DNA-binding NarL/FixJ family response regulator